MDLRRKTWTPTQPLQVDFWDERGSTTPFECKMMTIFIAFIIIITRQMVHLSKRTPAHLPLILRHRVLADVGASPSYLRICIQFFQIDYLIIIYRVVYLFRPPISSNEKEN